MAWASVRGESARRRVRAAARVRGGERADMDSVMGICNGDTFVGLEGTSSVGLVGAKSKRQQLLWRL